MGTGGVFNNSMDHSVFFHLEIDQIISTSEISHSNVTFPAYCSLSDTLAHAGGCRERFTVLFPSTLGIAERRKGIAK